MINMKIKTINDLKSAQERILVDYRLTKVSIKTREEEGEIKDYLEELKILESQRDKLVFFNKLEVGNDGTIFEEKLEKSTYTIETLEEFIRYVFSVKYYNKDYQKDKPMQLTFSSLVEYDNNATETLQEMIKYEDEKPIVNSYGIELYSNPKNRYSFVDSNLLKKCVFEPSMFSLKLQLASYEMKDVEVRNQTVILHNSSNFLPIDISSLSMREQNAFFGEKAQRILGVTLDEALLKKVPEDEAIKKKPYMK